MRQSFNVSLILYKGKQNETLKDILFSLNGYLLRNKGGVSDFNLVKDIVDRNIDKVDDEIGSSIATPLYLGLMGTMIGIVGGLVFMPSLSSTNTSNAIEGIDALLGGVKIAMIASVVGLLLTIISNYFFFKARKQVEHQKHDFFTFIQTGLLPILSKNTSSSIYSLQTNLLKFNQDFSSNMRNFSSTVNEVKQTFDSQLEVVQELKRIDVANIAKYNIDVMQQLKFSFQKLKDLGQYLNQMNEFIGHAARLNNSVEKQLDKVGEISQVVEKFGNNAEILSENSIYLKNHFANFDKREQVINDRIADYDKVTGDSIDNLQKSFNKRLQDFNNKDVEINSGFEKLFEEIRIKSKLVFEDESNNISAIKKEVDNIKEMKTELSGLNIKVNQQDSAIRELLDILKDKPMQMKQSMIIKIGTLVLASVGSITCGVIIYKLLTV